MASPPRPVIPQAPALPSVEARRIARAVDLPPVKSREDYVLAQELLIGLLGPDLLDYEVAPVGDHGLEVSVRRCFAHDNARRAGVAEQLDCGIFARVGGWLEAFDLEYDMSPSLGRCLKAQGQECSRTLRLSVEPVAAAARV